MNGDVASVTDSARRYGDHAMLLKVVQSGKLQPAPLVTYRFALDDVIKTYGTFGNAAQDGALKVILTSPPERRAAQERNASVTEGHR